VPQVAQNWVLLWLGWRGVCVGNDACVAGMDFIQYSCLHRRVTAVCESTVPNRTSTCFALLGAFQSLIIQSSPRNTKACSPDPVQCLTSASRVIDCDKDRPLMHRKSIFCVQAPCDPSVYKLRAPRSHFGPMSAEISTKRDGVGEQPDPMSYPLLPPSSSRSSVRYAFIVLGSLVSLLTLSALLRP
jgi:hypothetical protein